MTAVVASADAEAPRIAYVAYAFPVLTQTFTARETAALRAHGLAVEVFAAKRGDGADADAVAADEARRATYLPAPWSPRTLGAALLWFLRRPFRLTATALACLGGSYRDASFRCRLRAPAHVALGAALASEMRARGPWRRVHAQFVDAGSTVAFVAARLLELPYSFANHTAYNPFLLPLKCRHADLVVSITEFDRAHLLAQSGGAASPARTVVSRVGIRTAEWRGVPRRPEPGRVLAVGALREKKGHATLVAAAALLRARGRPVRLVFAGGGPEGARLRDDAARAGVDVEFLGPLPPQRVREEMARAAVFALPCVVARNGDLDGLPVALMEAMAAGVAVVSTRLSGIPELVADGATGLLVPPRDAEALAAALERLLGDPGLAARLGAAGAVRVRELHELDRTSGRLARLLSDGASAEAT